MYIYLRTKFLVYENENYFSQLFRDYFSIIASFFLQIGEIKSLFTEGNEPEKAERFVLDVFKKFFLKLNQSEKFMIIKYLENEYKVDLGYRNDDLSNIQIPKFELIYVKI